MLGFYIGGMGAKGQNYHTKLMQRMGYEEEALRVQELFFAGDREGAIKAVPSAFADEISLVGPPGRIKERLELWRKSPVTSLLVGGRDPSRCARSSTWPGVPSPGRTRHRRLIASFIGPP